MSTEARVIALMARVFQSRPGSIGAESARETVEGWDSLGHMNLCLALEEDFNVRLTDRDVTSMHSVGDIVKVVDALSPPAARR